MQIIQKYFPDLTPNQINQFQQLDSLYKEWNEKINVISRKDIDFLYERHVLHSLGISKIMKFKDQSEILDVGTGGGFPGIPLAILFPECQFHLIDSIGKKIKVVESISEALGLNNVKAQQIRAEQLTQQYDFVVSRAVTRITPFYNWVKTRFLKGGFNDLPNGILYLKGGDLDEELGEFKRKYKLYDLHNYISEDYFATKKVLYVPCG